MGLIVERFVNRVVEPFDVVGDEVRQVGVLGVALHRPPFCDPVRSHAAFVRGFFVGLITICTARVGEG